MARVQLDWHGDEHKANIKTRLAFNMSTVVSKVDADIKQSMASTPRNADGRSFPGNPPAVQTAVLIGSIHSGVEVTEDAVIGTVGSYDVDYAVPLELGSVHMEPRPFMVPAYERIREDVPEMLTK